MTAWKAGNGAIELDPLTRVFDHLVKQLLAPSHLLSGEGDRRKIKHSGEMRPGISRLTHQRSVRQRHAGELQAGLLASLIHGRQPLASHARRLRRQQKQADALLASTPFFPGRHDQQFRGMAIHNIAVFAIEYITVTVTTPGRCYCVCAPVACTPVEGHCSGKTTFTQATQPLRPLHIASRQQQRIGCQAYRGEIGRAQEVSAHLLHGGNHLNVTQTHTAILFRDMYRLPVHLRADAIPQCNIVTLLRRHCGTHGFTGRRPRQETTLRYRESSPALL